MHDALQKFQTFLKAHSHSCTKVREQIFLAMLDQEPLTMRELVKKLGDKVDRASVYRTVHLLESLGVIERLAQGWKYKLELSDEFSEHHHHITCLNCGKVVPIEEVEEIENLIIQLAKSQGFHSFSHQLEIRGTCSACSMI
ncbi:MAG: transcriptional regulator, Fur family transcriptional regulator, ferric uptake regulator [Candidatus Saccharibacteria bacterium]|nr:transcriptional regulator, Fur family transcriptional regulator, ferric uptake regulator [Candidatus Saccharibacteria bacterium]